MSEWKNLPGLKKPKLFSLADGEDQAMLLEYPPIEDALAKRTRTSEKFKENVFKSFLTLKAVFENQGERIEGIEDRQVRIEEDQERLKQLCDSNFKSGSDHIQFLLT